METLRSPSSSSRNEYSYQEEGDPNRFTLADYEYDRDEEASEPIAGPSSAPYIAAGPTTSVVHGRRDHHHHRQSPPRSGSFTGLGSTTLDKGKTRARALPDLPHPHITATPVDPRAIGPLRLHSHDNAPPLHLPQFQHHPHASSRLSTMTMMEPEMLGSTPLHPLPSLPHSFEIGRLDDEEHAGQGEEHEIGHRNGYGYGDPSANDGDRGHDAVSVLEKGSSKFADAVPIVPARATTWWGKILPSSLVCRLLLLTVILESCINLTIEGNILWRFNQELESNSALAADNSRKLPVYLVIFGLAHLWQLVLTFVAVHTKNTVQVTAVTAFNFAFLGYAVIEIYELRTILGNNLATSLPGDGTHSTLLTLPLNILTAVIIAVIAACSVILVVLAFLLRREFGWKRYKFLGADLRIRKYYLRFQVFECICYFSAFFCAGFGIQFIWLGGYGFGYSKFDSPSRGVHFEDSPESGA
ncbi:hypothetical protein EHS25_008083 [Saitozyma podzolica]|uniref:Uncharacterized protein n=1 Tax=Saitozyma podzolica TaxID=1890683 RepID=A0A427YND6_9TREE|nr:hypothetical protein EHS25_008083 [Saitozyma podzolica]